MHLTVSGNTAEELKQKIAGLAKAFGIEIDPNQMPLPMTEMAVSIGDEAEEDEEVKHAISVSDIKKEIEDEAKPKAKRGRRPKAAAAEPTSAPTPEPTPVASVPRDTAPDKAKVVDALQKLVGVTNMNVARDVLSRFGCIRISDIKEEQYPQLMADIQKAIETKQAA